MAVCLGLLACAVLSTSAAQAAESVLTNAADILSLSAERALERIPVRVQGVVTAAESYWGGRFFVQDATGGVFVDSINETQPVAGDLVEVSGVSHPGAFAPCITSPAWRIVGKSALPAARKVSIESLMSGGEDGQRVEVRGIVRAAWQENGLLSMQLMSGGFRLQVFTRLPGGMTNFDSLVGNQLRVRGTAAVSFNAQLRQMTTMKVFVPFPEDFMVEHSVSTDPFNDPLVSLKSIGQYRKDSALGTRVHVCGIVAIQRPGEDVFLRDTTGGLQIKSRQSDRLLPGEVVEAVGFPDFERFRPVLQDALFRKTGETAIPLNSKEATFDQLQLGLFHAELITLRARLLDRAITWRENQAGGGRHLQTVLMLQGSNLVFSARAEPLAAEALALASIPIGSILEVTGICLSDISQDGRLTSLQVLLPHADHVRILERPSWWTPQRLTMGLAGLFALSLLAVTWTVVIAKKNSMLKLLVGEKEQAQIQLQEANARLEERVRERSEQLRRQIDARRESEVQFQAVLNERTRMAQELHDTLEQTLTGIALQMDTATKFADADTDRARHHLELARHLVTRSQAEVRCSVWGLREPAPGPRNLQKLLLNVTKQLTDDTGIEVSVSERGQVRPLPELIEENLLRVAQEALTNVIKHAKASRVSISLEFALQQVELEITDNGIGFDVAHHAGPGEGHFGLLGITERTSRLNGEVAIRSSHGQGCTIQVRIPLDAPPQNEPPPPTA